MRPDRLRWSFPPYEQQGNAFHEPYASGAGFRFRGYFRTQPAEARKIRWAGAFASVNENSPLILE